MGALKLGDVNYTYEDYRLWEGDWELIGGVPLAMSPAPVRRHQALASEIIRQLANQLEECPLCEVLGEIDYKVSENTLLRPDIALTCGEIHEAHLIKAPEIVVEIISPATAKRDEVYKFDIYEAEKVRYYAIIYPDDLRAKVYKLEGSRYDKQGDFTTESYHFEKTTCGVHLDFKKLFARFRRPEGNGA